jgi:serine/threonine-protein kinase ULK/ATG1
MHRDLKPDNIFFNNGVVKLGDFGFCKSLEKANMTKTMLGSPIYMAPEILRGEIYSTKADIWSLGVVLYEMLYGFCPFESTTIPKLIEVLKETELEFPSKEPVSEETKRLLKKLLTKDPTKRIEWMELLKINITNEGKLVGNKQERLSLVDEDGLDSGKLAESTKLSTSKEKSVDKKKDSLSSSTQAYSPPSS